MVLFILGVGELDGEGESLLFSMQPQNAKCLALKLIYCFILLERQNRL